MLSAGGSANASASEAATMPSPKLLRPRRWRFFWLSVLSTFRLPLSLAVIGWSRGAALLRLVVQLWWRRMTIGALHSFSFAACFTRRSATRWRSNRLTKSGRLTTAAWPVFACGHRRRRAESYTLIVILWRILFTLPWSLLLASLSCWRATTFWLRRRTLEGRLRRGFRCSMLTTRCTRLWRSLARFAPASVTFKLRRRSAFTRSRWRRCYAGTTSA